MQEFNLRLRWASLTKIGFFKFPDQHRHPENHKIIPKTVKVNSSIKGYHVFKRAHPHPSVNMKVTLWRKEICTIQMHWQWWCLTWMKFSRDCIIGSLRKPFSQSRNLSTRGIKTLAATKRVERETSVDMAPQLLLTKNFLKILQKLLSDR